MCLAAISAWLSANQTTLLAIWIVFEQYLASNQSLKANSTLQLLAGVIRAIVGSKTSNSRTPRT